MIYIVIPVYNRKELTFQCLQHLAKQLYKNFTVIVVDDGSTDNTEDMIKQNFPETIILKGDGNLWWAGATNLGIKYVQQVSKNILEDYILTLNNDLIIENNYLTEFISLITLYPKSIIGSIALDINNKEHLLFSGLAWNKAIAKVTPIAAQKFNNSYANLKLYNKIIHTDLLPGRGVLIPLIAFNEVGLYDEKNFPQYVADEDFSVRAQKAGYKLLLHPNIYVLSHANETGTDFNNIKFNFSYLKHVFFSIKSPLNLKVRYKFAIKNTSLGILYFLIDTVRVFVFLLKKKLFTKK
jgi:GT2 family glycosyltransferase